MDKEDKELLIKDLCGRLPYGIICDCLHSISGKATIVDVEDMTVYYTDCDEWEPIEHCKPYLRPMSSMTEEERLIYEYYEEGTCNSGLAGELIDWLNKNMFDYRGLIEKGLALKAPKDMYMPYRYFPDEFSSYEDYVKYLKEKGLAIEAPEGMYSGEIVGVKETPTKTFPRVNEFINGSSYRH